MKTSDKGFMDKQRVMIVNDDLTQLCLLSAIVEKHGYSVSTYTGAETALRDMAEMEKPSVIITDIQMPGMDGWQFCRLLRSAEYADYNEIPVIVISSVFNDNAAQRTTLMIGADAFLSVPVEPDELIHTIAAITNTAYVPNRGNVVVLDTECERGVERAQALEKLGFQAEHVTTEDEALEHVSDGHTEVLVADSREIKRDPHCLVRQFRDRRDDLVILVVDETANRAAGVLEAGADAFVHREDDTEYLALLIDRAKRARAFDNVEDLLRRRTWELQLSREKSRTILESMPDAVYVVGPDSNIEYMNSAAEKLFGANHSQAPCYSHFYGQTRRCSWCPMSRTLDGQTGSIPVYYHQKNKFLSVSTSPISLTDGSWNQLCIVRDMTYAYELKDQLDKGEMLRRIGQFAGGMAHDFNNALGSIMGYADLARETNLDDTGSPIDPILGKRLEMILNAAGRTAGRVKQLLDFSRQGKYRHVTVDLHEIIGAVIESIRSSSENNLFVRFHPCSFPAKIHGDPNQIYSALSSISENGIEAMSGGGTLSISTWIEDASDGRWNSMENRAHPAQRIVVAIVDTGGGIDESVRRMMFDPFFSTKSKGESIGLGLSSAYGIMKVHGGDIDVETGEKGTTFKLWFPLPIESESASEQENEPIQTRNVEHSN